MLRIRICALAFVALALAGCMGDEPPAAPAQTTPPLVTLRIIFPEGFTRREMADRVAAVREIAIEKRGVTPRPATSRRAARPCRPPSSARTGS